MRPHLTELSRQLEDTDARVREDASRRLAELEDASAAALLRGALEDEDAGVRTWASFGLAHLSLPSDAGLLRAALVDDDPRVRLWAAYGLARSGDRSAAAQLVSILEEGPGEVRVHAARALVALEPAGPTTPLLLELLERGTPGVRTWGAAVLAGRGSTGALALWRRALLAPETRVEAALAAPCLRTPLAARDLVSLAARLPPEVLRAPAGGAGSLAELLTRPLEALALDALLEDLEDEPELRREVYLLLAHAPGAHVAVREALLGALRSLAPAEVGRELAEVLQTQPAREHPRLLAALAPGLPDAVVAAYHALPPHLREALLRALDRGDGARAGAPLGLLPELLSACPPPTAGGGAVRSAGPPSGAPPRAPREPQAPAPGARPAARHLPTAGDVLLRARVLGALVTRALLEARHPPRTPPDAAARQESQRLLSALVGDGLVPLLAPAEADLLELSPGSWDAEDQAYGRACAEALGVLLWALESGADPVGAGLADAGGTLARLGGLLHGGAPLRPRSQLQEARARCEAWLLRAEREAQYREARAGRVPAALDMRGLLQEWAAAGFDGAQLEERWGRAAMVAEGMRLSAGLTAARLLEEGWVEALVEGDLPFGGLAFRSLDPRTLGRAYEALRARQAAFVWLTAGGAWALDVEGE